MFFYNSLVLVITFHLLQINSSEDFSIFVWRVPLTLRIHYLLSNSVLFDLFEYVGFFFFKAQSCSRRTNLQIYHLFLPQGWLFARELRENECFFCIFARWIQQPCQTSKVSQKSLILFSLWLCCCFPSDFLILLLIFSCPSESFCCCLSV